MDPTLNETGEAQHYSFENVEWWRNSILAQVEGYTTSFDACDEGHRTLRCRMPYNLARTLATCKGWTTADVAVAVVMETKQNLLMNSFETRLISQHLHPVCTPRRGPPNPFLATRLVCDLPLQVVCVCNYTKVHLANELPALAAHAHALYKVFGQHHDLFELAGAQHESESLLSGSRAPVCVRGSISFPLRSTQSGTEGHATSDTLKATSKTEFVKAPRKLGINIHNRSNLSCPHCLAAQALYAHSLVVTANSSLAVSQCLPDRPAPQRELNDESCKEAEHDTVAGYEAKHRP